MWVLLSERRGVVVSSYVLYVPIVREIEGCESSLVLDVLCLGLAFAEPSPAFGKSCRPVFGGCVDFLRAADGDGVCADGG